MNKSYHMVSLPSPPLPSPPPSTFLQLFLCNPSPLPISLGTSMLAADIELSRLHSELPEVGVVAD